MARNRRVALVLLVTFLAVSGTLAYCIFTILHWNNIGLTGLTYFPDVGKKGPKLPSMRDGGVYMMLPGAPAARAGIRTTDDLVTINSIPYKDQKALKALGDRIRTGDTVVYRVRRDGVERDIPVRLESPIRLPMFIATCIVSAIVSVTFIAAGLLVFVKQPDDRRVWVFYAMMMVGAVYQMSNPALMLSNHALRGLAQSFGPSSLGLAMLFIVAIAFLPLTLHFALVFPRERPVVRNSPRVFRWVYGVPLLTVLAIVVVVVLTTYVQAGGAIAKSRIGVALNVVSAICAVAGMIVALRIARIGRSEGVRRAFWNRPYQSMFAIVALLLGAARIARALDSRWLGFAAGIVTGMAVAIPILAYPVLTCIALYRSYRDAGTEERRQVKWPLWGTLIAIGLKIVVGLSMQVAGAIMLFGGSDFNRWMGPAQFVEILSTLLYVLIPISFAFAILKYRLMNIDVIIRKTVAYALLSGAIVILYLALVGGLGTILVNVAGLKNQTMVIASTLVVALLVVPLRNKLQTLVDRNLFRHKYDYPAALKAIAAETVTAHDLNTFLASAAEKTQQALQNRAVVIFSTRHEELVAAAKVGIADSLLGALRVARTPLLPMLDRPFDPRKHALPEDAAAALRRIEAVLVVPVNTPGTPANGFIALAPKLSGGGFEIEDIDFLRSVADQLDMGIDRIRLQREEVDFEQARAIQQTLLPREMPHVENLDVSGVWLPARTVGGDYFDVLSLGERELAVCIGDVAGKGMSAALLMSGLQAAVRASASGSPRDLCERVRRVVVSSLSGGRFVTFFYATLDTASMTLRWCNAGHNAPILARADGTIVRLAEGGPAFSRLFRNDAYVERELALAPGDRLVLFTDGVSEASAGDGEMLGEGRLEQLVAQHRDRSARELQQTLVETATAHSGGQLEDDLTLVVVAVTPPA